VIPTTPQLTLEAPGRATAQPSSSSSSLLLSPPPLPALDENPPL
jgi:hypothetical protein